MTPTGPGTIKPHLAVESHGEKSGTATARIRLFYQNRPFYSLCIRCAAIVQCNVATVMQSCAVHEPKTP